MKVVMVLMMRLMVVMFIFMVDQEVLTAESLVMVAKSIWQLVVELVAVAMAVILPYMLVKEEEMVMLAQFHLMLAIMMAIYRKLLDTHELPSSEVRKINVLRQTFPSAKFDDQWPGNAGQVFLVNLPVFVDVRDDNSRPFGHVLLN